MALNSSEKLRKITKLVELYTDEGLSEQEILNRMKITRSGFNSLFMEAQKSGLVQLDPNRHNAFKIDSRALLAAIKKALAASDDTLVKLEKYDEKSICVVLCD